MEKNVNTLLFKHGYINTNIFISDSSVKDMHCLKNGVEIIINYEGTSPKVKKWDLRFSSKCILEYVLQNTVR